MKIIQGDCIEVMAGMAAGSVDTCVTSPPYFGLRDYGCDGQVGLESTPDEYVAKMVEVFRGVKRVLWNEGTVWLNLGDSYSSNPATGAKIGGESYRGGGIKPKDLIGIPWRVAFALQADGWYLRQDIIWHKPNPMPESVTDRCTKAHEYIFLLSKSQRYYYNAEAIKEENSGSLPFGDKDTFKMNDDRAQGKHGKGSMFSGGSRQEYIDKYYTNGRNKRSVWTVTTKPYSGAHFATFPPDLIEPCILAGCPEGGTVLDPFMGSGTTIMVAEKNGCNGIGIELNEDYIKIANDRLSDCQSLFKCK